MTDRPRLEITNHAIKRWQLRIDRVTDAEAAVAMLAALQTANVRHFKKSKIAKPTFYIPTERALFVGSRGRIVSVLDRNRED